MLEIEQIEFLVLFLNYDDNHLIDEIWIELWKNRAIEVHFSWIETKFGRLLNHNFLWTSEFLLLLFESINGKTFCISFQIRIEWFKFTAVVFLDVLRGNQYKCHLNSFENGRPCVPYSILNSLAAEIHKWNLMKAFLLYLKFNDCRKSSKVHQQIVVLMNEKRLIEKWNQVSLHALKKLLATMSNFFNKMRARKK